MGLGLRELLGKTEIDSTLSNAHEEVVRFDIAMNEVSRATDLLPLVVIRCKIDIQSPESLCS